MSWHFADVLGGVVAMLQADDEDDMMEQQMKSPFGSSFRTFDATDYKPIGMTRSSPSQFINVSLKHKRSHKQHMYICNNSQQ